MSPTVGLGTALSSLEARGTEAPGEACRKVSLSRFSWRIVMTRRSNRHDRHDAPLQRRAAARARSKCGGSAWPGGKALRLQRRAAPTHTAHAAVARKRSPARSCMMMSETPPPPSPSAGARSAPCTKRLDQRKAHDVFDIPTIPRRQRAQPGEHMWALGRAAPTPLVPSAQRDCEWGVLLSEHFPYTSKARAYH